jgi:hypothetical protein
MIASLNLVGKLVVWPVCVVVGLVGALVIWQGGYSLACAVRTRQWQKIRAWAWVAVTALAVVLLDFLLRGCTPLSPD